MADVAHADQDGFEAAAHPENGGDLVAQRGYVVAVALLAELTEAAEILADLRGRQPEQLAEIERGNAAHTAGLELVELAQIARQAADHVVRNLDALHGANLPYLSDRITLSIY